MPLSRMAHGVFIVKVSENVFGRRLIVEPSPCQDRESRLGCMISIVRRPLHCRIYLAPAPNSVTCPLRPCGPVMSPNSCRGDGCRFPASLGTNQSRHPVVLERGRIGFVDQALPCCPQGLKADGVDGRYFPSLRSNSGQVHVSKRSADSRRGSIRVSQSQIGCSAIVLSESDGPSLIEEPGDVFGCRNVADIEEDIQPAYRKRLLQ